MVGGGGGMNGEHHVGVGNDCREWYLLSGVSRTEILFFLKTTLDEPRGAATMVLTEMKRQQYHPYPLNMAIPVFPSRASPILHPSPVSLLPLITRTHKHAFRSLISLSLSPALFALHLSPPCLAHA